MTDEQKPDNNKNPGTIFTKKILHKMDHLSKYQKEGLLKGQFELNLQLFEIAERKNFDGIMKLIKFGADPFEPVKNNHSAIVPISEMLDILSPAQRCELVELLAKVLRDRE